MILFMVVLIIVIFPIAFYYEIKHERNLRVVLSCDLSSIELDFSVMTIREKKIWEIIAQQIADKIDRDIIKQLTKGNKAWNGTIYSKQDQ